MLENILHSLEVLLRFIRRAYQKNNRIYRFFIQGVKFDAFGASSISQLSGGYIQNVKEADEYINRINDGRLAGFKGLILSQDQKVVREAITVLMCNKRLNWSETASRAGISPERLKNTLSADHRQLNEFQSDGLVLITDEGITLTEKGSLFIRNIAAALDPAFHAKEKKYSKSV